MGKEDLIDNPNVIHNDDPTGIEVVRVEDGTERVKSRFYFFMAAPPITGGDLVIVDHAKALIAAGVDARFLYLPNKKLGTTISDFPAEVPLNMLDERVCLTPSDFLITGESQGPLYRDIPQWLEGNPEYPNVVMLNQAVHWMPFAFDCPDKINNMRMSGLICASDFVKIHAQNNLKIDLNTVFKKIVNLFPVNNIPKDILKKQKSLDRSNRKNSPKCRITFINNVRKRYQETTFLPFYFLSLYPEYQDKVEFVEIKKMPHHKALETMRSADIFILSGYMDTANLSAIEAMSLGCHVIGYTGILSEVPSFTDENGWWFKREGELSRHVQILKEAIDLYYATDRASKNKRSELINNALKTMEVYHGVNSPNTQIVDAYRQIWEANIRDRNYAVFSSFNKGRFVDP